MKQKAYHSATAFRMALETRLKKISVDTPMDLQALRRRVAFDRFLVRVFKVHHQNLVLKGGYAMELRIEKARVTRDIDLAIKLSNRKNENRDRSVSEILRDAASLDLGDFFVYTVGAPTMDLEAVPYGGKRYPVEAKMDNRLFVRFPIDVVVTSLILNPVEEVMSRDWLDFAGIPVCAFPAISKEQQFAEKLHAYTLPREDDENSRVKDVVDLLLLMRSSGLRPNLLMEAITTVFEYRGTHALPEKLKAPPANWESKFNNLAKECEIESSLTDAFQELCDYINDIRLKTID